jgi:antirestriction protein
MSDTMTHTAPSAWVGCWGCYNGGSLIGKWLEGELIGDPVAAGLATLETVGDYTAPRCVRCFGDEFGVFDHQNMLNLVSDECSLAEAAAAAETVEAIEAAGIDLEAAAAYIEDRGEWDASDFEDSYQGEFNTLEDFAQDLAYGCGLIDRNAAWPHNCINWEHAALELSYDYALLGDRFIFRQV